MADANSIATRAQARGAQLTRYFTGKPCKHGHIAERLTVNGSCVVCTQARRLAAYRADPAADLARQKAYREAHPERLVIKLARRYAADPALAERAGGRAAERAAKREARERGEKQYASTRPCAAGHYVRFVGDGHCVTCNQIACQRRNGGPHPRPLRAVDEAELSAKRVAAEARAVARAEKARQELIRAERRAVLDAAMAAWEEAKASGAKIFQGTACTYGHDGRRYTCGRNCVECAAQEARSDEKKAYDKEYLDRNRERILERSRAYHARQPSGLRNELAKQWAKRNPEKRKAIADAYKHRRRQLVEGGDSTAAIAAWEKQAPKVCYWCSVKCPKGYHIDHYQPLSKGGRHEVANLVIACRSCNCRKSAKDPYEFAKERGRLF